MLKFLPLAILIITFFITASIAQKASIFLPREKKSKIIKQKSHNKELIIIPYLIIGFLVIAYIQKTFNNFIHTALFVFILLFPIYLAITTIREIYLLKISNISPNYKKLKTIASIIQLIGYSTGFYLSIIIS